MRTSVPALDLCVDLGLVENCRLRKQLLYTFLSGKKVKSDWLYGYYGYLLIMFNGAHYKLRE